MTASTLKPNDLVIAISATGRTREVVEAVELAKHYRAKAICVTAPDTDLAAICDVALTVDVPEYPDTLKPTASRYAFLAIIDLVSVAVGYRLDGSARETLRRIKYNVPDPPQGQGAGAARRLSRFRALALLTLPEVRGAGRQRSSQAYERCRVRN